MFHEIENHIARSKMSNREMVKNDKRRSYQDHVR
jgi:hypothetical protein